MKRRLLAPLAALLLTGAALIPANEAAAAPAKSLEKLGLVDLQRCILETVQGTRAKKELEASFAKGQSQLDKKTQDAVMAEAKKAEEAGWAASQVVAKDTVATLAKNGMTVGPASAQFKQELQALGKTMTDEWVAKAGPDGKALVDAYRK